MARAGESIFPRVVVPAGYELFYTPMRPPEKRAVSQLSTSASIGSAIRWRRVSFGWLYFRTAMQSPRFCGCHCESTLAIFAASR